MTILINERAQHPGSLTGWATSLAGRGPASLGSTSRLPEPATYLSVSCCHLGCHRRLCPWSRSVFAGRSWVSLDWLCWILTSEGDCLRKRDDPHERRRGQGQRRRGEASRGIRLGQNWSIEGKRRDCVLAVHQPSILSTLPLGPLCSGTSKPISSNTLRWSNCARWPHEGRLEASPRVFGEHSVAVLLIRRRHARSRPFFLM